MSSELLFVKNIEEGKKAVDERLAGKHIRTLSCLHATSTENDELRHRVSELEGYKLRADYYATMEQDIQSLQNELAKCEKLHSLGRDTEEKINEIQKEYLKSLHDYKKDIEERYKSQVESYIVEKEENVRAWEQEKAQMKKVEEELRTSNKILQKKLEAAAAMEKDTNNLTDELEQTVVSFEEIKARNEVLQESKNNLQELCASLESENTCIQDEIDNISYDKRKLKKDMNKMVMKITKYTKKVKELEQFKNTVSRLEFENSWAKHLHDKTLTDLKNLTMKHRDALSELQAVTQDRNLLTNELSSVQQEVTNLKDELTNSKHSFTEFLDLKRQVDILQEENKRLSKKFSRYKLKMLKPDTSGSDRQLLTPIQKLKAIKSS